MGSLSQGGVTVQFSDSIQLKDDAGQLGTTQVNRLRKAYKNAGAVGTATAQAMRNNPAQLTIPGVDPAALESASSQSDAINQVIAELDILRAKLQQSNLLWDAEVHGMLGKVVSFARTAAKYQPGVLELVPDAVAYFAKRK